jgi:tRNA threonylcarbamoyladenosine biosynthesis protein TsaE
MTTTLARTTNVDETRELAAAVAGLVRPGDLLLLVGDLGAGKTAFTQGFARALGIAEQVTSPTFTLARSYIGRLVLHHLDVYRLDRVQEAEDLGLAELLDDGGVVVIEWGDAIVPVLQPQYLEVRLSLGMGDDDRELTLRPVGSAWANRAAALRTAVGQWAVAP